MCARLEPHYPITDARDVSIPTCYPAARAQSDAAAVALATSDVTGIDIRVQRNRAYKITGTIVDASGALVERAQVGMVSLGASERGVPTIDMRSGGQFLAWGITPGDYAIQVELGSRFDPNDKHEPELGYLPNRSSVATWRESW